MDVVERWWNGSWGRLTRRDVWLLRGADCWVVRARRGDADDPAHDLRYPDEPTARRELGLLLSERGPWTRLST